MLHGVGNTAWVERCVKPGVIAAAGIWALDHHIQRLAEDHENARIMEQDFSH